MCYDAAAKVQSVFTRIIVKKWFSNAHIIRRLERKQTCCAILIHSSVTLFIHGERMSSKQCPSLYRLGKKPHFDTYSDKQGWKSSHQCLLQERLRLLNDGDNKSSVLSARYAKGSHVHSALCTAIISCGPIHQGRDMFFTEHPSAAHQHISDANYNQQ